MSSRLERRVRAHGGGDLIACSTLQDRLSVFETSFGAWAYRRVLGMDITLGAPLCAPADRVAMIERFLARSRRPIFCYVRADFVRAIDGHGLCCAGMGVDRHVDVPALLASPKKEVRGALKKADRAGFRLTPIILADLDGSTRRRLEEVSERYLAKAECTVEMRFLNRPMSFVDDGMRRVFALSKHDREHDGVFGFAVLNPVFEDGRVTRYLLDLLRFEPTKLWGVWPSTVFRLAEQLASEGHGMTLGFCPLHRVQPAPVGRSRALDAQIDWMERWLESTKYLRRLRELKALIPGPEEPRFFASFSRSALVSFAALSEASGVGLSSFLGPDLLKVLGAGLRKNVLSMGGAQ